MTLQYDEARLERLKSNHYVLFTQEEIDERIEALEKKIMSQKYEAKCKRYGWNPKEDIHL